MKSRNIIIGFVAASLLVGCSIFDRKPVDYKSGAVQTPSLEIPPDLTVPESEQRYTIPGTDGEKVASYSEYTKKKTEQPCVNPVSVSATVSPVLASTPSAKLIDNKGSKSISLGEPFDRSWRRVGLAIDHARLVTSDKDRSKGIFFVAPTPDKANKDDKKKLPDYQVVVRESGENSEVTVVDASGKSDAESARLIDVIFQNLDKNDRGDERRTPRGDAVRTSR